MANFWRGATQLAVIRLKLRVTLETLVDLAQIGATSMVFHDVSFVANTVANPFDRKVKNAKHAGRCHWKGTLFINK